MSISGDVRDSRARTAPRNRRPVLLNRLPGSVLASPGFAAAAGAGALVYGLALSVYWKGVLKNRPATPPPVVHAATTNANAVEPPKPIAPKQLATAAPVQPQSLPQPQPAPNATVAAVATPGKAEVIKLAANIPPVAPKIEKIEKPAEPPRPNQPERDASALGDLIDPSGKAQLTRDGADLALKVPGKFCFLNPAVNINTSPRALTGVEGDFDLVVRVVGDAKGEMKPGADALKNAPPGPNGVPVSFNGAGLLVWQDAGNFLRLERGAGTQNGRNFFPIAVLELWKDGKLAADASPEVPPGPLSLRIGRQGGEMECSYSVDGRDWTKIKESKAGFSDRVEAGILGSNTSKKSFTARFEGFRIGPRKSD